MGSSRSVRDRPQMAENHWFPDWTPLAGQAQDLRPELHGAVPSRSRGGVSVHVPAISLSRGALEREMDGRAMAREKR